MATTTVAVLGSINMDLTAYAPRLPRPGETLLGDSFAASQGGKGANQALAAARSGARTIFLGAVGDDTFAQELLDALADSGVDITRTRRTSGASGTAIITVDAEGENTIVVVPGANASMSELTDAERSTIAEADILLCQLEIPLGTVIEGASHARDNNTLVVLNPSPVQELPDALLAFVDILVLNEAEAASVRTDNITHVVTTLGAAGARYDGPETSCDLPSATVDVVDTTGAGDAFAGALAAEWHRGPLQAVQWACAAGAFATTRRGAGSSSGTRIDIEPLSDRRS